MRHLQNKAPPDAAKSAAPVSFIVIVPSEAWRILRGASPRRVRANHPPVSSVAPAAERPNGKETVRSVNKAGEAYTEKPVGHRGGRLGLNNVYKPLVMISGSYTQKKATALFSAMRSHVGCLEA